MRATGQQILIIKGLCTCSSSSSANDLHRHRTQWRIHLGHERRPPANAHPAISHGPDLASSLSSLCCVEEVDLDEKGEAKNEQDHAFANPKPTWAERSLGERTTVGTIHDKQMKYRSLRTQISVLLRGDGRVVIVLMIVKHGMIIAQEEYHRV